ncbi:MAG: glucuronate isomerase [Verrucomicrobiales bacterium]|jgi:glucuronate isomerase
MSFIHDDFLLKTDASRRLFHEHAKDQPIIDFHNHLPPQDIASNRKFANLFEIWLEGDHYKWRAMRANGAEERLCTGDADPYEKFLAFAKTVPNTLRNPLYHWTHLELKRYFGIEQLLDETTAPAIWETTKEQLAGDDFSTRALLKKFKVRALCTTDDPGDDLAHHIAIAESDCEAKVYPTFRPDKALHVHTPEIWNAWIEQLGAAAGVEINSYSALCDALKQRHDFFHSVGGRLSDHGMDRCFGDFCSDAAASTIFDKARGGTAPSAEEREQFGGNLMLLFGQLAAEKGWTMQLHLGPIRNNNTRLFEKLGGDIGCDSIGDFPQAETLSAFLGKLSATDQLPKTVLYNNNPRDNFVFATMAGNFPGVQFGSGWWSLDQKEGMEWQLNALSNCGLLTKFIGMLTDSRSFMSFPRHEYFRRTLCNLVGQDVEDGLLPEKYEMLGPMIENICFNNARDFLGFSL